MSNGYKGTLSKKFQSAFLIKLTDVDENDNENKATVVVALMQKDSRLKRTKLMNDSAEEFIHFILFKVIFLLFFGFKRLIFINRKKIKFKLILKF